MKVRFPRGGLATMTDEKRRWNRERECAKARPNEAKTSCDGAYDALKAPRVDRRIRHVGSKRNLASNRQAYRSDLSYWRPA